MNPLRALVIEDDFLLAEMLADALVKLGCKVLGSAVSVEDGVRLAGEIMCDFAIVDLDLRGEMAFPIFDRLHARGIPCLMATGAFPVDIPEPYRATMRLSKPYDLRELHRALGLLVPGFDFPRQVKGPEAGAKPASR